MIADSPTSPPVVAVVGFQNSGKTTLVERLVATLRGRGVRVGTIKHSAHGYHLDQEGRDSARHFAAGAARSMVVSGEGWAMQCREEEPPDLAQLAARWFGGMDLVVAEGFGDYPVPQVLVFWGDKEYRFGTGGPVVAAVGAEAPRGLEVPCFEWSDVDGLTDFLLRTSCPGR